MPLYEYQCLKCGERFEEMQKFSDPPLTKHQDCGGKLKKLLSAPAIQFKGSGWYVTDYARKSDGAAKDGEGKKEEKTEKKTEKKTEAKSSSESSTKSSSPETSKT